MLEELYDTPKNWLTDELTFIQDNGNLFVMYCDVIPSLIHSMIMFGLPWTKDALLLSCLFEDVCCSSSSDISLSRKE